MINRVTWARASGRQPEGCAGAARKRDETHARLAAAHPFDNRVAGIVEGMVTYGIGDGGRAALDSLIVGFVPIRARRCFGPRMGAHCCFRLRRVIASSNHRAAAAAVLSAHWTRSSTVRSFRGWRHWRCGDAVFTPVSSGSGARDDAQHRLVIFTLFVLVFFAAPSCSRFYSSVAPRVSRVKSDRAISRRRFAASAG